MPSSIPWVLLLLAGLCYQVPGSLLAPRQDHSLHQHGRFPNIATKLDNFAFSLYRRLAPKSNNNIFFSPVSIATAFTKLSLGTKGNTGTQILQGLDFNFKETAKANTHNFQLTSTSVLFMDKNLKQVHEFLEDVTKLYHFSVNFRDTEEATKQINQYIEKGTQGKIVDLVMQLSLRDKRLTWALLLARLCTSPTFNFPGKWEDNFKFEHIVEGNFYVSENTKIKVLMMSRLGMFDLHWEKELSSWLLRQSCQGRVSAFLILPNLRKRQQLESKLAKEVLAKFLEKRQARSASLRLPKLSISGTYDLKSVLSKMGITKVFSAEADLSETLRKGPSVSSLQAMHKAMLSIDENVTEYSGHLSILFNWPFLVIIKDENTNIPLFMGKMVNPMQK
uniref:Serpin domain-containing protein n=1 Tax=Canis lupus familiaris TaxID=9615 RepID=A0A8I3MGT3_CANLF